MAQLKLNTAQWLKLGKKLGYLEDAIEKDLSVQRQGAAIKPGKINLKDAIEKDLAVKRQGNIAFKARGRSALKDAIEKDLAVKRQGAASQKSKNTILGIPAELLGQPSPDQQETPNL